LYVDRKSLSKPCYDARLGGIQSGFTPYSFKVGLWKKLAIVFVCAAAVVLAVRFVLRNMPGRGAAPVAARNEWKTSQLKTSFAGIQVREIDSANAAVIFFFDLENATDTDVRLINGPNLVLMSRSISNSSLTAENHARLQDNLFVPAHNRTRIGITVSHPLTWPLQSDATADAKIRDFAAQRTADLRGFVLFDQTTHLQIELPGGWQALQRSAAAPKSP